MSVHLMIFPPPFFYSPVQPELNVNPYQADLIDGLNSLLEERALHAQAVTPDQLENCVTDAIRDHFNDLGISSALSDISAELRAIRTGSSVDTQPAAASSDNPGAAASFHLYSWGGGLH